MQMTDCDESGVFPKMLEAADLERLDREGYERYPDLIDPLEAWDLVAAWPGE